MNLEPLRDALLPCPFCGGEVEYVMPPCSDLAEYVRHKQPNHCPVEFTAFTLDGGREMIAAWNTRAPDPEIARQREVIEAWHDIDRKRDAEIERLREANGILEDALQEVGDDYPGSSCQEWCRQQVKVARAALDARP